MQIEIANLQNIYKINEQDITTLLKKVLNDLKKDAELSVVFVDDKKIKELNNSYLGEDVPTDVLAFSLNDSEYDTIDEISGEIIVSVETAINTAEKLDTGVESELFLYLVHGLLHLVGYDDKDKTASDEMHEKERLILAELGYKVSFNHAIIL